MFPKNPYGLVGESVLQHYQQKIKSGFCFGEFINTLLKILSKETPNGALSRGGVVKTNVFSIISVLKMLPVTILNLIFRLFPSTDVKQK